MSTVEHIEAEIRELAPDDLARLRDWFFDYDAKIWDERIKADAKSGKLDALKSEALADFQAGRKREL